MDIIGQNWIRFENNRKVKYRCSRSDFIVSGRFFDRGTWNYPEERFGRIENPLYFCTRRDGRVVDCGGLENRWTERFRGFESLFLRWKQQKLLFTFYGGRLLLDIHNQPKRRDARVVEEARLESVYTSKAYHGFESRSLRTASLSFSSQGAQTFFVDGCCRSGTNRCGRCFLKLYLYIVVICF